MNFLDNSEGLDQLSRRRYASQREFSEEDMKAEANKEKDILARGLHNLKDKLRMFNFSWSRRSWMRWSKMPGKRKRTLKSNSSHPTTRILSLFQQSEPT